MFRHNSFKAGRGLALSVVAAGAMALAAPDMAAASLDPATNLYGFNGYQDASNTDIHTGWFKFGPNGEENCLWQDPKFGIMGTYFNVGYIRNGRLCGYFGNHAQQLYLEFNLATGDLLVEREFEVKGEEYAHRNMLSGAYNPVDDCVYGFALNNDQTRDLFVKAPASDPENVTIVRDMPADYAMMMSCCFSPVDNHMYGIDVYGDLVRCDVYGNFELVALKSDMDYRADGMLASWESGMTYSPKDNAFIWSRQLPTMESELVKIDAGGDHKWSLIGSHHQWDQFVILACTDTDGDDNGPVAATIKSVEIDHQNPAGTIVYVMPTRLADGNEAPSSMIWTAVCGGVTQTGTAGPGEEVTVVYSGLTEGEQNFTFRASTEDAKGASRVENRWVGADTPDAPGSVLLSNVSGGNYRLTWTAPEKGTHNGYLDSDNLLYAVFLDNEQVGTATRECGMDVELPTNADTRAYYFEVRALCKGLLSEAARSNQVFTGRGYGVPYMIVPDEDSANKMTVLNVDNDRSNWGFMTEVGGGTAFFTNRDWDNSGDDYLITPPLWLDDTSRMYNISFEVKYHNNNRVEEFYDVWLGTGASEDGIREKRVSPKTRVTSRSYYKVDYDFAVPAAGTYYLGIHYVGDPDQGGIYVRDIRITKTTRSGVEDVSADNALSARAGNGEVILEGNGDAAVYSTDGCLVATARVDGSAAVGVAPGVYLVKAGEKTFKLLVK